MINVQYRVKRAFSYGGKRYEQGEIWEPQGGKWDNQIISNGTVVMERLPSEDVETEPKAVKRGVKAG